MEILLANVPLWRWRLHEEMQCMFSLKSNPTQAIRWLTILAGFYPLLKRLINKFCHGFANFDRLERRQLWLNPCHHQLAHKDDSLQVSQSHHWCPEPCKDHHQYSGEASRPLRFNCHQPGVAFHLKVLIITMLFFWHQVETFHCLPPTDRRSDQKAK